MPKATTLTRRRLLGFPPTDTAADAQHPNNPIPNTQHPIPGPAARRRLLFQPQSGPSGDVLVCLFLRGGADGLHLVAPYGDPAYYAQRPRIAVARPDDARAPEAQRGVVLDDFFALNPALARLQAVYRTV